MLGNINHLSLLLATTSLLLTPLCSANPSPPNNENLHHKRDSSASERPEILWRGEVTRTPARAQRMGALYSEGLEKLRRNGTITNQQFWDGCSLYSHSKRSSAGYSQYISASRDPFSALYLEMTERRLKKELENQPIYLYKIHADHAIFELNASLGVVNPHPQEPEWVSVGLIPWVQVMGWYTVNLPEVSSVFRSDMTIKKNAVFHPNSAYNASMYEKQRATVPQPQLAGFPRTFSAWEREPWKPYKNKPTTQLLGEFVWHHVCERTYACYRLHRPLLRATSLTAEAEDSPPAHEADAAVRDNPPKIIFIGHFLWPDEVKKQNGFLTAADRAYRTKAAPPEAYTLKQHLDVYNPNRTTYFIQGSENFGTAAEWAARSASRHTNGFEGVVYAVHATPNMIDVGLTVGNYYGDLNPTAQRFAIAGGVKWSQVRGWVQIPANYTRIPAAKIGSRSDVRERLDEAFKDDISLFQSNPDYDKKFDKYTANKRSQKQLFSRSNPEKMLKDFMTLTASAYGWTGSFPLFEVGHLKTATDSKRAKQTNRVPQPHEPGTLARIRGFMEAHPVAVSLLPEAVASIAIPGSLESGSILEAAQLGMEALEGTATISIDTFAGSTQYGAGFIAGGRRVLSLLKNAFEGAIFDGAEGISAEADELFS